MFITIVYFALMLLPVYVLASFRLWKVYVYYKLLDPVNDRLELSHLRSDQIFEFIWLFLYSLLVIFDPHYVMIILFICGMFFMGSDYNEFTDKINARYGELS